MRSRIRCPNRWSEYQPSRCFVPVETYENANMAPTSDTQTTVAITSSTIDLAMPRMDGSLSAGSGGNIGDGAGAACESSGGGDALCDLRLRVLSLFFGDDGRSNRNEDEDPELDSVLRSLGGSGLLEDLCRW